MPIDLDPEADFESAEDYESNIKPEAERIRWYIKTMFEHYDEEMVRQVLGDDYEAKKAQYEAIKEAERLEEADSVSDEPSSNER